MPTTFPTDVDETGATIKWNNFLSNDFWNDVFPLKDAVIKWGKVKMFILQTRLFTYNYQGSIPSVQGTTDEALNDFQENEDAIDVTLPLSLISRKTENESFSLDHRGKACCA